MARVSAGSCNKADPVLGRGNSKTFGYQFGYRYLILTPAFVYSRFCFMLTRVLRENFPSLDYLRDDFYYVQQVTFGKELSIANNI